MGVAGPAFAAASAIEAPCIRIAAMYAEMSNKRSP